MSPTEIAALVGKSRQNVQKMLAKMYTEGKVMKQSHGRYTMVSMVSPVSPSSPIETIETYMHAREDDPAVTAFLEGRGG